MRLILVTEEKTTDRRRRYFPLEVTHQGTWDEEGFPAVFVELAQRHGLKLATSFVSLNLELPEDKKWDDVESDIIQTLATFAWWGDADEVYLVRGEIEPEAVVISPEE